MTFFDVRLTSSVLTKFKVTWKFLAEDNTVHDIPYLETLFLTTPQKKKKKKKKKNHNFRSSFHYPCFEVK